MTERLEPDPYELPPEIESERLRSLRTLRVLHTPPEDRFGVITRMARVAVDVPMSAINLMDHDRQWCKQFSADYELDFNVPRQESVCRATIARAYSEPDDLALIYDDLADSEFAELPAVTADGGVRFYAGFPLFGPGGHPIGTFCVYDTKPRRLNPRERATFGELAAWAQREIESTDQLHTLESAQTLLRASADSMLDPQVLLEAVRDDGGRVVDFRYLSVNKATCVYLGLQEHDLVGRCQHEDNPNLKDSELQRRYVQCLEDGEPVILADYAFFNEILDDARRYDIQATRAGTDLLSLTWRDVTQRFTAAQELAASERQFRLIAENSSDVVCHIRNDTFVWISPSAETILGAHPSYWLGRGVGEILPPHDLAAHATRVKDLDTGGVVQGRVRVKSVDGVIHWAHLHARPFFDTRGGRDGTTASFRLIDDEVAAEEQREQARRREARAEARFRRSMDNAAIAMCIVAPDGAFVEVNAAMCALFGYDAETLLNKTWQELTAPEYLDADLRNVADILEGRTESYRMHKQYIAADGRTIWAELSVSCVRDENGRVENFVSQIADVTAAIEATQQYRLLAENAGDMVTHIREDRFVWVSPSVETVLGATPEYWTGRQFTEIVPPDQLQPLSEARAELAAGRSFQRRVRVRALDGTLHWIHLHAKPFYNADGHQDGATAALRLIDDEVAAQQQAEDARRQQAIADARYRRSIDSSAIGMCMLAPGGTFLEVNPALCDMLGYDAEALLAMTWQDITTPDNLEVGEQERQDVFAGLRDSYRIVKQYRHADGHPIWADVAVSSVRDPDGGVEALATQIADITDEVESRRRLAESEAQNRQLAQRLQSEMRSAVQYVESILPGDMTGPVAVSSRYMPSQELGGDGFHFRWIDDEHLKIYMIDVSGHGIQPALLSTSVHNLIQSGTIPDDVLLHPAELLNQLNESFRMEDQGDHYFTVWYGIYESSTRTLRYACAGHPPAVLFAPDGEGGWQCSELSVTSAPVSMFDDTVFTVSECTIPVGSRLLIFSDGAFELPLPDGEIGSLKDFIELVERLLPRHNFSLDTLVEELRFRTTDGGFDDDCSLVLAKFDD